jgi:hypothetical protein
MNVSTWWGTMVGRTEATEEPSGQVAFRMPAAEL